MALAKGRPSAAKTGTVGIESGPGKGQNSDAWMVGFTPQVSTAVWVGSGDSSTPVYSASGGEEYGRDLPGRTWKAFMDEYLSGQPDQTLPTKQLILGNSATLVGDDECAEQSLRLGGAVVEFGATDISFGHLVDADPPDVDADGVCHPAR